MSFNIALDDVSIMNLTFGREFTAAVEAKQVPAQDPDRPSLWWRRQSTTKEVLLSVLREGPRVLSIIRDAISNNPAFITLKIEASREMTNTISTSHNCVFLSADSRLLNLQDLGVEELGF